MKTPNNPAVAKLPDAPAALAPVGGSETCAICNWANTSLNLGEFGKPRWVCHGCCKRLLDAVEKTIADNLHLADGEVCTLIHLKRALYQNAQARPAAEELAPRLIDPNPTGK